MIYLSGAMTGLPDNNFPAFHDAAERLRDQGWYVLSPAESGLMNTREEYMRHDINLILSSDAVVVIPGFADSEGVAVEITLAHALGIPVYHLEPFLLGVREAFAIKVSTRGPAPVEAKESVCEEADRLVSTDRQGDYGHPLDDFTKTATMWSVIFGFPVDAAQVPLAMIAVKISRELNKSKRDNLVDICGYAKTLDLVNERRAQEDIELAAAYAEFAEALS